MQIFDFRFVRSVPAEKFEFEFFGCGADGATVVGLRDFPENDFGIEGGDSLAVPDRDIAVIFAVNQEDRSFCRGDCGFGRNLR